MSSGITLSSATRQNLLSLQGTADLLATTQNRLATNKKVNSALDNPTNFFTASSLSSRSTSLSNLLDGISNGIQTIQAANTGLTKLQGLTDQLKSVAQQALASSNAFSAKATNTSVALTGASATNLLSMGATQVSGDLLPNTVTTAPAVKTVSGTLFGNGLSTLSATYAQPASTSTIAINGTTAITINTTDTLDQVISNINSNPGGTAGVVASKDAGGTKLVLTGPTSGAEISVVTTGVTFGFGAAGTYPGTGGALAASTTITINGTDIAVPTGSNEATVIGLINAQTSKTGVTAKDNAGKIDLVGADDGSAVNVTTGTGNKSALGATVPATAFSPTANTLLVGALGFKDGDNLLINGQSVSISATDNLGSFAQKVSVATNGTVSASFDNTTKKFSFTAADANTGVTITNGSTLTSVASKLGFASLTNTFAAGLGKGTAATASLPSSFTKSSLDGKAMTVQVGTGNAVSLTFGSAAGQVSNLTQLNAALAPANAQATIDGVTGKITITTINDNGADDLKITSASTAFTSGTTSAIIGGDGANTRNGLVNNYNNLLNQINQLASDAGYNGLNLLAGDTLKMVFNEKNTSTLNIQGSAITAANLGLNAISTSDFQENSAVNKLMATISSATAQLKAQASSLGSNLAVVQNRQDFTKQIITVLDAGAANLTNADLNEEAANSQALSTRNSLGISALSLANQAQQGVLQLLR